MYNPKNIGLNTSCLPCIFLVYSSPRNLGKRNMRSCTRVRHMPYRILLPRAMLQCYQDTHLERRRHPSRTCEESGIWCHFWSNIDESFNRSNTELDLESLKRHTNTLDCITCLAGLQIFDSFHGSSWISEPSFPCFPSRDQRRPVRLCEGLPHLLPNDPHRALLECRQNAKTQKTRRSSQWPSAPSDLVGGVHKFCLAWTQLFVIFFSERSLTQNESKLQIGLGKRMKTAGFGFTFSKLQKITRLYFL